MRNLPLCATTLSIALTAAMPAHAEDESLRKELEALRAQVAALQAEVEQMRAAPAATTIAAPAGSTPASANAPAQRTVAEEREPQSSEHNVDATRFWGYGELNYNHPT